MLLKKSIAGIFSLTLACLCGPVAAQYLPFAGSDEPIWTDRPVRIDRAKQHYERVAGVYDRYYLKIRVRPQMHVPDGGSFIYNDKIYLIAKVIGPDPKRLCRSDSGSVFACGGQSRAFLRKIITGRYLECFARDIVKSTRLVDCRLGQEGLAETLVKSGFVRAAQGSGLSAIEDDAIKRRAGLWADLECRMSQRC